MGFRVEPHGPECRCDSFVEVRTGTEHLPCPAIWDAFDPGVPFGPATDRWWVAHRIEGRLSMGVKVWMWWQRAAPSSPGKDEAP